VFRGHKRKQMNMEKAEVKIELLTTARYRKLSYNGLVVRKQEVSLENEIIQGTLPRFLKREGQRIT